MTTLDKLIKHFERFPGIGSRQARRFAYHLLTESDPNVKDLASLIASIKQEVTQCVSCYRFYARNGGGTQCRICADPSRDTSKLMVVERDADVQAIERSSQYDGLYFVLGGTVPLLDTEDTKKLHGAALKHLVEQRAGETLAEIIIAFAVNPDGENTGRYVEKLLRDTIAHKAIKLSYLGRGLSTGSELEYADPETIKYALGNRQEVT